MKFTQIRLSELHPLGIFPPCIREIHLPVFAQGVSQPRRLQLRGAATVLTDGKIAYVNVTGNSAQATGGTGDVLAGVIAGLCAQGVSVLGGGRLASYLVGKSAEFASKELSEYSATPSDFIDYLGKAFLSLSIPEDSNE